MIFEIDKTGSIEKFEKILKQVESYKQTEGILILACDANEFVPKDIDAVLKDLSVPVFGGIFPEIIYGKEKFSKGTIVVGLNVKPNVAIIDELSNDAINYEDDIDNKIPETGDCKTMFVFVDGFSRRINSLIESLFDMFGLEFNYIGGGAGSLSLEQKPCLFTNNGLIQDSAVLAMLDLNSGIGVSHGWEKIEGPYKVTESDRNVIKTLDWQPAFSLYKGVVENHSGKAFTDTNFFDLAKGYPFGISKLGTEQIVRDPLILGDDQDLICVGEVPQDSFVNILAGNNESLIKAAEKALDLSRNAFDKSLKNRWTMFIDCISRVLFLEDNFDDEINAVFEEGTPLIGALTIGEIANSGTDYLEFYNKTSVVGILEE